MIFNFEHESKLNGLVAFRFDTPGLKIHCHQTSFHHASIKCMSKGDATAITIYTILLPILYLATMQDF